MKVHAFVNVLSTWTVIMRCRRLESGGDTVWGGELHHLQPSRDKVYTIGLTNCEISEIVILNQASLGLA